jgi:mannosyltransferase
VVNEEYTERKFASRTSLILIALTLLAAALRFWHLSSWSLDSDEVFMLRDSLRPDIRNPRPLLYFLNHYLVSPLIPLNEFGLRLLPAIFGVLAIPVFFVMSRKLIGARAALFGTLLLSVSPLHVYYSQFARYWSLVFLLCCVYPYAIYIGLRERSSRFLLLGIVTALLAILAHPASVLLFGGLIIWAVNSYVTREGLRRFWSRRSVQWGTLIVLVGLVIAGLRMVRLLHGWISEHDSHPGGSEFLLKVPTKPGLKQILYLIGFAESLTFALVLTGLSGFYLLWRSRDGSLRLLLTSLFLFPVVFLTLLSFRTPVSAFYLVPTIPTIFMGVGFFLDRAAKLDWELQPHWILSAMLALIIIGEGAPTLASQYRDGRRYNFRGAAHWLADRIAPEDVIFSDQYKVMIHYLPEARLERLRAVEPLAATLAQQRTAGQGALWIVIPAPGHAFRTSPNISKLKQWIYDNCRLRHLLGVGRIDFREYYLEVYSCGAGVRGEPREVSSR